MERMSALGKTLSAGTTGNNRPDPSFRTYRIFSWILRWGGLLLVLAGAGAVIWGSLLPWITLKVFDISIVLPGVVGLGAATAAIGLLTVTRSRSYPLITLLLGIVCVVIGDQAPKMIGRQVVRHILEVKQRLAPVNARLEQVNLPPVEPFPGVVLSRNYVGPGPLWTVWGGIALTTGAAFQLAGNRLGRTCARCGSYWHPGRNIAFCPNCGALTAILRRCDRCFVPLEKKDRFCANCGTPNPADPVLSREPGSADMA